jgi:ribonuclease E
LKTNIEAVHEIARQLRLRNIGGMIIIDFIDMTNRVDKLTMMEELELAMEDDKAKPQVGQLSDLGLVEMTRHRQGQAISEIFAKRCPHCQGNGYIMEDIKFASSTSEGEYRAKAAKLKLPMNNNKKNNKFNKNNRNNELQNNEVKELEVIQEEKLEMTANPSLEAQVEVKEIQEEKETRKKNSKKPRFDKGAKKGVKKELDKELAEEKLAQTVVTEGAEIAPVVAPDAEVKPAKKSKKAEAEVVETPEKVEEAKKPARSKRPNRNTQKKPRATKKSTKKNEE